jgi:hypothetical protein
MSCKDKAVTAVTTGSHSGHYFDRRSTESFACSSMSHLECKLKLTGIRGLRKGFFEASLIQVVNKARNHKNLRTLIEAPRRHCGLTLSEFQDIMLSLRLALGSPGDV